MEVIVPELPESTTSAKVSALNVRCGDSVGSDQILAEIETDKVILEIVAPAAAVVAGINVSAGDFVESKQLLLVLSDVVEHGSVDLLEADSVDVRQGISVKLEQEYQQKSDSKGNRQGHGLGMMLLGTMVIGAMLIIIGLQ
ncbi:MULTISPECIES: biotin/lipoyl-containing protein [Corallincola]|uniref:Lipoyl-binding domain-containing protein n=2 Tax=Corallincola TaxID=1775176 RepID=A0A368NTJ7_9GAMM|nr:MULTISPECIES: biotin/lipoyl-containing protein [Corallincola]RCU52541.1 hypothetical protein DU002_00800 [Corallincola holothuriorum]TAA48266.1 hypothetical protein EXY25_03265 [Corallincola spongiicola]